MHLYVIARANKPRLDKWVNDLLAQNFDFEIDKNKFVKINLSVRPIQLFEIVFPEDSYEEVLAIVQPYHRWGHLKKYTLLLRKLLGLKPIQKIVGSNFKVNNEFVDIIPIGIKKDIYKDGIEQI